VIAGIGANFTKKHRTSCKGMVISDFLQISTIYTKNRIDMMGKPFTFIHLPTHPPVELRTRLSVHLSTYLRTHLANYLPTHLPISPICASRCGSI